MSRHLVPSLSWKLAAGLGLAASISTPSVALAQGMLCPVTISVSSSETLGALQLGVDYASATALGDIVDCEILPVGTSDVLVDDVGDSATLGYADTTGFTGPATFASCVFRTVGDTAPVAGDFLVNVEDASNTDVPPSAESPMVSAAVGACVPSGSCSWEPATGCKVPTAVEKSKISFKNDSDNTKDQAQFQWKSGAATMLSEFADPTTAGETWSWCAYAGGTLVHGSDIPSGTGWAASGTTGFQFKGDIEGVAQVKLKAGEAGKASVAVKAKSKLGNFASPALPLVGTVVAQLVVDDGVTTTCYQSTAGTPSKNDSASFSAKGNP